MGKHGFVEKPITSDADEAAELVELARSRGRVLMVGHTFLYSPPVRRIQEMIDSGELGDIYYISSTRVNLGLHPQDISVVWDLRAANAPSAALDRLPATPYVHCL